MMMSMMTSGARGRTATLSPENEILSASRIEDWSDAWGTCLSWLGAICDILTLTGEYVPDEWQYSPSPYMSWDTLEDYPGSYIVEMFALEPATLLSSDQADQLYFAGWVFHRIIALVPEEDRY
jgi:hypothetical protein